MIGQKYNVSSLDEWYNVSLEEASADPLVKKLLDYPGYSNSLVKALESIYPEYNWQHWQFDKGNYSSSLPKGYWNHSKNRVALVEWLSKQLSIENLDDWYSITRQSLKHVSQLIYF